MIGIITFIIILLIFLGINIISSPFLEYLVGRHIFFQSNIVYATIIDFEGREQRKELKDANKYITIVQYDKDGMKYIIKIMRCKEDKIGRIIKIAVKKNNPLFAVRLTKEKNEFDYDINNINAVCEICILVLGLYILLYYGIKVVLLCAIAPVIIDLIFLPHYILLRKNVWENF